MLYQIRMEEGQGMRCFRPWRSRVFRFAVSAAEGMGLVCGGTLGIACLVWKLGMPPVSVLRFAAGLLWCTGAFLAGRRCGLHGRRYGALEGAVCGILLLAMRLLGARLLGESFGGTGWYVWLLPLTGSLGGVLGVNTKLRRAPD